MYRFKFMTGEIEITHEKCHLCPSKICVSECDLQGRMILRLEGGVPLLGVGAAEVERGLCTECLACEFACATRGRGALRVILPVEGLQEWREKHNPSHRHRSE